MATVGKGTGGAPPGGGGGGCDDQNKKKLAPKSGILQSKN